MQVGDPPQSGVLRPAQFGAQMNPAVWGSASLAVTLDWVLSLEGENSGGGCGGVPFPPPQALQHPDGEGVAPVGPWGGGMEVAEWQLGTKVGHRVSAIPPPASPPPGENQEESGGSPTAAWAQWDGGGGAVSLPQPPPPPPAVSLSLRCCHSPLSHGGATRACRERLPGGPGAVPPPQPATSQPQLWGPPLWQGEGCVFTPV